MWKYKVIISNPKNSIKEFENIVSEYLNAGWKLSGGICINAKFGYMFQAVYKLEWELEK
jgi:hypothetical protein